MSKRVAGYGVRLSAALVALLMVGAAPALAKTTVIGQLAPKPASAAVGCPAGQDWDVLDPAVTSGRKYVIPAGYGTLTSWSTRANSNSGQTLELNVYRRVSGSTFQVVGQSGPFPLTANKVNTFHTNLPVSPGDIIGLGSPAPSGETACSWKVTSGGDLELQQNLADLQSGTFTSYSGYRDNVTAVIGPPHTAIHNGLYWSWLVSSSSTLTDAGLGLADLNGSGGGELDTGGHPAGEAVDAVAGKIYWASYPHGFLPCGTGSGGNQILVANLNGTGRKVLKTTGATVDGPAGMVIDRALRKIFWVNELSTTHPISWARLNGTGGGNLSPGTATVNCPAGITIDPALGRVYWANAFGNTISYAGLNGSGGGDVSPGAATVNEPIGVAIDPTTNEIYWANYGSNGISFTNLSGAGPSGNLSTGAANLDGVWGVAIDPLAGRIYWANNDATSTADEISYANLNNTGGGNVAVTGAPASQAKFPILFKAPVAGGAPNVTGPTKAGSTLSCSRGTWSSDIEAALLYEAPQTFSYHWTRNGVLVAGATKPHLVAKSAGSYVCTVTARNYSGAATQKSAAHVVSS